MSQAVCLTLHCLLQVQQSGNGRACDYEDGAERACLPGNGACPLPVDCIGAWSADACDANCQGERYVVSVRGSGGGQDCAQVDGTYRECMPGSGLCPAVVDPNSIDCVGAWAPDECDEDCRPQVYRVAVPARGDGAPCAEVDGAIRECQAGDGYCTSYVKAGRVCPCGVEITETCRYLDCTAPNTECTVHGRCACIADYCPSEDYSQCELAVPVVEAVDLPAGAGTLCSDSSDWEDEFGAGCAWYAAHDPGCMSYMDGGQREHCRRSCANCVDPSVTVDMYGAQNPACGLLQFETDDGTIIGQQEVHT